MTEFEIAMTYGARGTMAKALEQLEHVREDAAAAPTATFEHLMSVLRAGAEPAALPAVASPSSGPAASELTAWLQTPMNGTVIGVLTTVLAARGSS
jgi:hypothetical protein